MYSTYTTRRVVFATRTALPSLMHCARKKNISFSYKTPRKINELTEILNENFRQHSRENADSAYLKMIFPFVNCLITAMYQ